MTAITIFRDISKNELNKSNFAILWSIQSIFPVYIAKCPANE
ncbi:hypothetical protein MICAK_3900005 [Microcystis aeruginosa PCC 9701]|uniref:Uncharacterized protein n=1 Tax=Microcystis aeruginosa PCC 9701 TaxID=721123 RepID=I4IV29_MICAE|nr:hypothetical protein MICAK_3900005 [Microcystis aeruginosa PCC 9701]